MAAMTAWNTPWNSDPIGFSSTGGERSHEHHGESVLASGSDAVETYFECISTCSLDDAECITVCTEVLRGSN